MTGGAMTRTWVSRPAVSAGTSGRSQSTITKLGSAGSTVTGRRAPGWMTASRVSGTTCRTSASRVRPSGRATSSPMRSIGRSLIVVPVSASETTVPVASIPFRRSAAIRLARR
jgi:hypothetical protein